jgi:hypothetical protein
MAANTAPIYSRVPKIGFNASNITAANTTYDGSGANQVLCFTAGADGARVEKIRIKARGTNVATVMRIFVNNGSAVTTATNNSLIDEIALAATTATQTAALATNEILTNIALPPGYTIYVTIGTAVAAGFSVTVFAGDY